MKKIYIFLFSIFFLHSFSQAPKLINYQGIVRNAVGVPVTSPVKLKFEIFPVSSGGSSVFSEIQSTSTNSLGLFSTQIGKNSALNINWSTGSWFLELSVDTTNTGSSFTIIGRQQMVSVPFALYAESAGSAPAPSVTFSNNILYVGTNSVSLPPAPVYFAGNGIAINSGTIMNTAPDQTVTITGAGNAVVNGPYPDFTVTANPQVLSITNNVISLSNGGGNVVLPSTSSTPNTSLTSSGIATVTTSGTNTFNIAVAAPTITGAGGTTVGGTYPNFVINSPTVAPAITPTITGAGIASTSSSGNNFTVNVPSPTLSYASNVLTISQGTASSVVTIPAGVTPTISGQGIATVTPLSGNNFTVNVAPLNLTGLGSATVGGTYPNITINTPLPPAPAWSLLGNSGTIDGTHFLGTTDNIPLNFRVNNQKAGRIDPLLSNTFFGYWSGKSNTSGTQNTAYGINSLMNNIGGAGNTAIGTSALETNTSGNQNTAVGIQALLSNSTGSMNTASGYQSLYSNTTGSVNAAFGANALLSNTTGYYNAAMGAEALRNNTNGTSNTGMGSEAMYWNNGSNNAAVGFGVMQNNFTGSNNTALGAVAGYNSTGSGNVFIGFAAGYSALGSNQLHIANSSSGLPLVYGDFSTGRIGLGTTSPGARLEIVNAGAGALRIADGSQAAGKVFTSDATGLGSWQVPAPTPGSGTTNFLPKWNAGGTGLTPTSSLYDTGILTGVGTSAPTTRLHLLGVNSSTFLNAFSASPESAIRIHNGDQTNNNFSSLIFSTDASNSSSFEAAKIVGVNVNHTSATIAGDLVFMTRNSANINEVMRINSGGNIGIGTPTPANRLHVSGGGVTITDGTEGLGKVLTSDASGNATWKPLTVLTVVGFNNKNLNNVGTTPTPLSGPLASFTKGAPDTKVEVIVQTHLFVGDMISNNSVIFEVRVNGVPPASGSGRTNYFIDNNNAGTNANFIPVTIIGQFPSLTTGSYNVEIWVNCITGGGSATSINVDAGNYSASSVTIKEYR